MKTLRCFVLASVVCFAAAAAQRPNPLNLPPIVQLPSRDFVWRWGEPPDEQIVDAYDVDMVGTEEKFTCRLTAELEVAAEHMSDVRHALTSASLFIQESTAQMNELFRLGTRGESWATLSCETAESSPTEEHQQEQLDQALERAERRRERRRERSQGNQ